MDWGLYWRKKRTRKRKDLNLMGKEWLTSTIADEVHVKENPYSFDEDKNE